MSECPFCNLKEKTTLIKENNHALALVDNYFREGHCVVILKEHKISISEISEQEHHDLFCLIKEVSVALEKIYDCEKTYLLSIGDQVEHLHFHLIPKHKDKCSMGVYCFGKLFEEEGQMKKTPEDNKALRDKILEIL